MKTQKNAKDQDIGIDYQNKLLSDKNRKLKMMCKMLNSEIDDKIKSKKRIKELEICIFFLLLSLIIAVAAIAKILFF